MSWEAVISRARELLTIRVDGVTDLSLWEHSERVAQSAELLARLPEWGADRPDPLACGVAALFHDAGWAVQFHDGTVSRWQLLARPTNDMQRELGAGALIERVGNLLPHETVEIATEAIRHLNVRNTALVAARVVAEAEALDEVGVLFLLRQFRQYQAEGRPLEQLLTAWLRQLEYRYWDARINDGLAIEVTRAIARERLKSVEQFMQSLARDRELGDLRAVLRERGLA